MKQQLCAGVLWMAAACACMQRPQQQWQHMAQLNANRRVAEVTAQLKSDCDSLVMATARWKADSIIAARPQESTTRRATREAGKPLKL